MVVTAGLPSLYCTCNSMSGASSLPCLTNNQNPCLLGFFPSGICGALSLDIKTSPEVRGYVGEQVVLKCSFKSSSPISESLTIDWTYRPLSGGRMETVSGAGSLFQLEVDLVPVHSENLVVFSVWLAVLLHRFKGWDCPCLLFHLKLLVCPLGKK